MFVSYSLYQGIRQSKAKAGKMLALVTTVVAGLGVAVVLPLAAHASPVSRVVVTPTDLDYTSSSPAVVAADGLNKWFLYNDSTDTVDNTLGTFVTGPATPPNGVGSVQFTLGASPDDRKNVATYQFGGTELSAITALSYSAYSHSGVAGPNEAPYLNFNVDLNGSGTWQKRLVYVPSANLATVPQDTWNTYDTISGGNALWTWSGYAASGNKWPDNNTSEYRTWSNILASFPSARVLPGDGWLGVRVGEPGPTGYTGNVDALTFGTAAATTTYDFEPVLYPTSKTDCTHNGWKQFTDPSFKNQGQCIKWVNSEAEGNLAMSGPSQKIRFNVRNTAPSSHKRDHDDHKVNTVEYWNYDYPGTLHYTAAVACAYVNPWTNETRFMFQIPTGHPGLSGLYVVAYAKETKGRHTPDLYGHAATSSLATAMQWCKTGIGFAPSMYTVTKGNVEVE